MSIWYQWWFLIGHTWLPRSASLSERSWREVGRSCVQKCWVLGDVAMTWHLANQAWRAFLHWENYTSNSFHIEWDMIVVTAFLSILNQREFHLVQNRKENCHHDHIPFNVKGIGSIVFSVQNSWGAGASYSQTETSRRGFSFSTWRGLFRSPFKPQPPRCHISNTCISVREALNWPPRMPREILFWKITNGIISIQRNYLSNTMPR